MVGQACVRVQSSVKNRRAAVGEREILGGLEAAADAGADGKANRFIITSPTGTPSRTTHPRNLPLSLIYSPTPLAAEKIR
jgi:hypothetical protein